MRSDSPLRNLNVGQLDGGKTVVTCAELAVDQDLDAYIDAAVARIKQQNAARTAAQAAQNDAAFIFTAALFGNGASPAARLDLVSAALAEIKKRAAAGGAAGPALAASFLDDMAFELTDDMANDALADLSLGPVCADVAARRAPTGAQVAAFLTALFAVLDATAAFKAADTVLHDSQYTCPWC